jgi:hypothetical protein
MRILMTELLTTGVLANDGDFVTPNVLTHSPLRPEGTGVKALIPYRLWEEPTFEHSALYKYRVLPLLEREREKISSWLWKRRLDDPDPKPGLWNDTTTPRGAVSEWVGGIT